MGTISDRLAELGLELPPAMAAPAGVTFPFELVKVEGSLAYVAGHGPLTADGLLFTGQIGDRVTPEQGCEAARATALSMLRSLQDALGDLDRVARWVKVLGFVRCAEGFDNTPMVINGFTDLIVELWGDAGRHARSAIGADQLPFGMPVEVEAIVAVQ